MTLVTDGISRTRTRIVQSPERIKRNISTMGDTVVEEKRLLASHESKTRDLQQKIQALLSIEQVSIVQITNSTGM